MATLALTTAGAYVVGRRLLSLPPGGLAAAAVRMLECLGISAAFFALNTVVGMALALGLRELTPGFVSLYVASDVILLPLSLAQGLLFWWWWRAR